MITSSGISPTRALREETMLLLKASLIQDSWLPPALMAFCLSRRRLLWAVMRTAKIRERTKKRVMIRGKFRRNRENIDNFNMG